jgi:hypothetical protein
VEVRYSLFLPYCVPCDIRVINKSVPYFSAAPKGWSICDGEARLRELDTELLALADLGLLVIREDSEGGSIRFCPTEKKPAELPAGLLQERYSLPSDTNAAHSVARHSDVVKGNSERLPNERLT